MPYIKEEIRRTMLTARRHDPETGGELNFAVTMLVDKYWSDHGPDYQTINDILGALEGAKLEFYRRIAVPYENRKIVENGDVYTSVPKE